ncbi:hypothetical protein FACS1894166_13410 [Bacilli bacterium]|nr:hypothetical protein FACS1894166_13410 [Bacilli bacterium]
MQELKINTIGDLARADGNLLKQVFGKNAEIMQIRAQGLDDGDFVDNTPWIAKSISHARTFPEDVPVNDTHQLLASLSEILAVLIEELRDKHAKCKTIELKIRNEKFVTITRSISVKDFTDD